MVRFTENCREDIFTQHSIKSSHSICSRSVLGKTLLTLLPALVCGCSAEDKISSAASARDMITMRIMRGNNDDGLRSLDIFIFKDGAIKSIDCYQRIESPEDWEGNVSSSSGDRIINICANSQLEKDEWPWIRSQEALKKITISLELESRDSPFMSGEASVSTDNVITANTSIYLRPAVSEIYLRSLCCDFTGKPYDGEQLTDIKVYLTNINAECGMFDEGSIYPARIINAGRLCEEDIALFTDPGLVYQEIGTPVGRKTVRTDIRLWCYPSNAEEESPGTPYSRLVIEGKIAGVTYYWPININRDSPVGGIYRNQRYVFDVKITRKGSDDPDIPVNADNMEITFNAEPWEEKENCQVIF